jgi:Domain of unknown function (DUF6487)
MRVAETTRPVSTSAEPSAALPMTDVRTIQDRLVSGRWRRRRTGRSLPAALRDNWLWVEMMESHNQCPKCNGEMKQGFILDHKDYASGVVAQWQPGEPQKSFWRGVKSKDGPHYEITAYRCTGCGFLESYAK